MLKKCWKWSVNPERTKGDYNSPKGMEKCLLESFKHHDVIKVLRKKIKKKNGVFVSPLILRLVEGNMVYISSLFYAIPSANSKKIIDMCPIIKARVLNGKN